MVVSLPFTVKLYHDEVFQVNPLEYVHFESRVINDVSFDGMSFKDFFATIRRLVIHNGYDIMGMIDEELHPKKPVSYVDSDSDVETNHPLDDVAHVVEQFEHEIEGSVNIPRMTTDDPWLNKLNDHNKLLAFCGRDVSEGKCAGLKDVILGQCQRAKQCALFDHGRGLVEQYSKLWQYRQAIFDTNPGSTCELETKVNDEDEKLYFRRDDLNLGDEGGINIISDGHKTGYPMLSTNSVLGTFMPIFKKRWSGLQFKRLFWAVAATSMESVFLQKMEEIKMLDEKAHEWWWKGIQIHSVGHILRWTNVV
ncbi:hypothetical protein Tco_0287565 [Tanacetum coccineum]